MVQPAFNTPSSKSQIGVVIGLSIAIVLDTIVQLCWKLAVVRSGHDDAPLLDLLNAMLHQPLTYLLLVLFIAQFVNWIIVLGKADLSYAQPITAMSYVLTCFGSAALFGDRLPPQRWLGIALILGGVWFVSRTAHRTGVRT